MKIGLLIAAALLPGSSSLSAGEPARSPRTLAVQTGDLDLNSAADRDALDRRLAAASLRVCRGLAVGSPFDQQVVAGCWRRTLALAREQASLALTQARSGTSLARKAPAR